MQIGKDGIGSEMIPSLETERLLLRAPKPQDYPTYVSFFADAEASSFYGGPLSPDQTWRVLAMDFGHWALRGYGRWVIESRESGKMVGSCGLWWPEGLPRSELTWWLLPEARGKGFATEASIAAISFGYDVLKWDLVETHMNDNNVSARRLVERLGGTVIVREQFPDGITRNVYQLPRG